MFIDESSNYWKFRIREPKHFKEHRYTHEKLGVGVDVVWGITSSGKSSIQALRFHKSKFPTKNSVKIWLSEHPSFRYIG